MHQDSLSKSVPWPYKVNYGKKNVSETDVLVIGGGIAGCHAAINAAKKGVKVAVVDKGPIIRSGDGGAGVDHWHLACSNPCSRVTPDDIMKALKESYSDYSYSEYGIGISTYILCKESWDTLLEVEQMGVRIRDIDDEFVGAPFRDEETKLLFAYDYENKHCIRLTGGADIKVAMYQELKRYNIDRFEHVMVTRLLNENGKRGAKIAGATGVNKRTGEYYVFKAKAVILSTGFSSGLWVFNKELAGAAATFSDPNNTADGPAIAWEAGVEMALLENHMPANGGFSYPSYGAGNAHNSWYACNIVDDDGKEVPWVDRDGRILETIEERNKLAPGQKVFLHQMHVPYPVQGPTLIPDLPERIQNGEFKLPLYADLPGMPEKERRAIWGLMVGNEGRSRIIYNMYSKAGFDPDTDLLQSTVLPPQNYIYGPFFPPGPPQWREARGGGPVIDWDLRTNVEGLYSAGAVTLGAADHACSATMGRYAGRKAAEYAKTAVPPVVLETQIEEEKNRVYAPVTRDAGIGWKELKAGLCRIMQDYCGEYKSEKVLRRGLDWFASIKEGEAANAYARNPHELVRTLECLTHISVGEAIIHACLARKSSSRMLFFNRLDFPDVDPEEWQKFVTIKLDDDGVKVGERPLGYWLKPPFSKDYEENYQKHAGL
jgi:succinate dehydrogenase/fumarate reductase flavoprotein subunit